MISGLNDYLGEGGASQWVTECAVADEHQEAVGIAVNEREHTNVWISQRTWTLPLTPCRTGGKYTDFRSARSHRPPNKLTAKLLSSASSAPIDSESTDHHRSMGSVKSRRISVEQSPIPQLFILLKRYSSATIWDSCATTHRT